MANDLTSLTTGGFQLPAALAGKKAASIFTEQKMETGAEGLTGSYGIIKFGGKVWSLSLRGQKYPFMRRNPNNPSLPDPNDPGPRGSIDVVVVRVGENLTKTYYPDGYVEGSRERPKCWSNDGKRPDPQVPAETKQASACGVCPNNVWGSAITAEGNKVKACGDAKRLAVVLHPDLAKLYLGAPLSEAVLLRLPASSLNDFGNFGSTMDRQGYPLNSFISRISFDPEKKYPRPVFQAHPDLPALTAEEGVVMNLIRNDPITHRIIADDVLVESVEDVQRVGAAVQQQVQEAVLRPVTVPNQQAVPQTELHAYLNSGAQKPAEVIQMPIVPRMTPEQQAAAMAAKVAKAAEAPTTATTDAASKALEGEVLPPVGDELEAKINAQVQALLGG